MARTGADFHDASGGPNPYRRIGYRVAEVSSRKSNKTSRKGRVVAYEPRTSDVSQNKRRAFFLETVIKCEPKVLEDLSQEPLRFFRNTALANPNILGSVYLNTWELLKSEHWHQVRAFDAHLLWFRRNLWEWGQRWNLNEEWCLSAAFYTLIDWEYDPEPPAELSWSIMIYVGGYTVPIIPGEDKFSFEHRGWELTSHPTRKRYEEFIRKGINEASAVLGFPIYDFAGG
jgi:hypothetical protein